MEQQHKPFEMLLDEVRAAFDREKNLKNECFLYILQRGLFDDYEKWKQQRRGCTGAFAECVAELDKASERQTATN